jgi:hypothetical protein
MPKYRVTINYAMFKTEVYEIDTQELADEHGTPWNERDQEDLEDSPWDFCCDENQVEVIDGDVLEGSVEQTIEEIPLLDRIVEAINEPLHCDE